MIKLWLLLTFIVLAFPKPLYAHAFGSLYNLPVPFWMYLYGGAAAIVVSFLIVGYFLSGHQNISYPNFKLFKLPSLAIKLLKIMSVSLFGFTILSGLIGADNSYTNFNMTFFWIIFLLGLTYLTAVIGNIYFFINPWKILVQSVESILHKPLKGFLDHPRYLGYYPALIFYFLFIWIELNAQTSPFTLSIILIQYTFINIFGCAIFGKEYWFKYCEFFSVFFGLISKMAPIELKSNQLYLRLPFVGILKEKAEHFSLLLFILFMLSSTAFDGFSETIPWISFTSDYPQLLASTIGLILSPFLFLVIYWLMVRKYALQFAFTLLPIALVYNVAHYYTLILSEGQRIIGLISDPFSFGWNLFGTANFYPDLTIIDANFTWHFQVFLILLGHIAAVYLSHALALKYFPSEKEAIGSQLPMLLVMVSFTMIGLWILSQPITSGF